MVISDAIVKGVPGFDLDLAREALWKDVCVIYPSHVSYDYIYYHYSSNMLLASIYTCFVYGIYSSVLITSVYMLYTLYNRHLRLHQSMPVMQ